MSDMTAFLQGLLRVLGALVVGFGLLLLALWNLVTPDDDEDE